MGDPPSTRFRLGVCDGVANCRDGARGGVTQGCAAPTEPKRSRAAPHVGVTGSSQGRAAWGGHFRGVICRDAHVL